MSMGDAFITIAILWLCVCTVSKSDLELFICALISFLLIALVVIVQVFELQ